MNTRPIIRADCEDGPRPCLWRECRWHLDVTPQHSCTLDIADKNGATLETVAEALGITKQRVEQIEKRAVRKLRVAPGADLL